MIARTARLDADIDPVVLGSHTGLLWSGPELSLAGVGGAARIPLSRPDGGEAAAAALAALAGSDDVAGPGTGPVAFAALPFDRTAAGELIVPAIVVGRAADGRRWITAVVDDDRASDPVAGAATTSPPSGDSGREDRDWVAAAWRRVQGALAEAGQGAQPTAFELTSGRDPEDWTAAVAKARDRILAGELTKAVLARELRLVTDVPLDPAVVLGRLRRTFPSALLFSVDGFVGASPELLVGRSGDVVRAHPLAGTAPRATDPASDARQAATLLSSDKDRWEHQITIDWLLDTLLPFCSYVDAEPEPSIVTLANVHHLGTLVEGRLSAPPASVLELVAALHPTPAVGGDPQDRALALIDELEGCDRGRYAGPVGWVDAAGNGQFAVGIRSAQFAGDEVRLFAGVGVVADSDPLAELAETRAKFAALLGALVQP